jgi:predicted DNA-binding transcriptional regulator AlpA
MRSNHRAPLPALCSPKEVRAALGISASTLHRMVLAKAFPKAIPISPGRIGWRRETVERWLAGPEEATHGQASD